MGSPIGTKASEEQCYMGTYHSTRGRTLSCSSKVAIRTGIAPDGGLFVSDELGIQQVDISSLADKSYFEIAQDVLGMLLNDYTDEEISACVNEAYRGTFASDEVTPLVKLDVAPGTDAPQTYVMELFGGPTSAFKDVALQMLPRLMARTSAKDGGAERIMIVTATSGDTGGAVANGFLGVEGIDVVVLYPKGRVSDIQEKQFTTLGRNVTALEIEGTFDDCQRLVKSAFADTELKRRMRLTSANSINVARFLPQTFYFFHAYAQLRAQGVTSPIVVSVPSGNFGNLTAGLFARRMGLPVDRFIAANNANDTFYEYLRTGSYRPRPSVPTLANAMDVGDPNNFARILDLYGRSLDALRADVAAFRCDDDQIRATVADTFARTGYLLDPHGACGYRALRDGLRDGETGIFLETAHPAKFLDTVESITGRPVEIPQRLQEFVKGEKRTVALGAEFEAFKEYLLSR